PGGTGSSATGRGLLTGPVGDGPSAWAEEASVIVMSPWPAVETWALALAPGLSMTAMALLTTTELETAAAPMRAPLIRLRLEISFWTGSRFTVQPPVCHTGSIGSR